MIEVTPWRPADDGLLFCVMLEVDGFLNYREILRHFYVSTPSEREEFVRERAQEFWARRYKHYADWEKRHAHK
jgi:hypothetical protein